MAKIVISVVASICYKNKENVNNDSLPLNDMFNYKNRDR